MTVESPTTYGDFWSRSHRDYQVSLAERYEKELSPFMESFFSEHEIAAVTPKWILDLFGALKSPQSPALAVVGAGFLGGVAHSVISKTLDPAIGLVGQLSNAAYPFIKPNYFQALELDRRGFELPTFLSDYGLWSGINKTYQAIWEDFSSEFPSFIDIIRWARYQEEFVTTYDAAISRYKIPKKDYDLWTWLSQFRPDTLQNQMLFRRGKITAEEFDIETKHIGWNAKYNENLRTLAFDMPNASILLSGLIYTDLTKEEMVKEISNTGIHPDYAEIVYEGLLDKPNAVDVIEYWLRTESTDEQLDNWLKTIGVNTRWTHLYHTLAWHLPPIQDIITMAVREAFTPEIAERFGQYQDFPEAFQTYGVQKGFSADWCKRYWAAHWSLPSTQMAFEMFQRGVIDEYDLNLLLRALDIMPYWREKLRDIAYNPLTRVDIRRMYAEGVLNLQEVYKSYLETGYSPKNAQRLTDFTIKYTEPAEKTVTISQVISCYKQGFITANECYDLLIDLNETEWSAGFLINKADAELWQDFVSERIKGIHNLYNQGAADLNDIRTTLTLLGITAERIETYIEQWYRALPDAKVKLFTKDETLQLLRDNYITIERAIMELRYNGYSDERISIILKAA